AGLKAGRSARSGEPCREAEQREGRADGAQRFRLSADDHGVGDEVRRRAASRTASWAPRENPTTVAGCVSCSSSGTSAATVSSCDT
ncbi:hypothetical protein AB1285_23545, partial [Microbacterium sp. NRRL B-14842]|uniref:hypothetical protein n=1 Tax=Microbacterium sp. NRRL B-14842 TaxID=3162881 RepID=UPI003D29E85B